MAVSRADRRADREPLVRAAFGDSTDAALDLLELTEYAWHDCYAEITPPDQVVLDLLEVSEGDLATLARACKVGVVDFRDLRVWADTVRSRQQP